MNWGIFSAVCGVGLVILAIFVWATDFVTLKGEWTIYTADCVDGQWQGSICNGRMVASERYHFRALKAHREVLFWTIGDEKNESGRFLNCVVQDSRSWSCPATENAAHTITRRMTHGVPQDEKTDGILSVHRVPKWKWEALQRGVPVGSSALN